MLFSYNHYTLQLTQYLYCIRVKYLRKLLYRPIH